MLVAKKKSQLTENFFHEGAYVEMEDKLFQYKGEGIK